MLTKQAHSYTKTEISHQDSTRDTQLKDNVNHNGFITQHNKAWPQAKITKAEAEWKAQAKLSISAKMEENTGKQV